MAITALTLEFADPVAYSSTPERNLFLGLVDGGQTSGSKMNEQTKENSAMISDYQGEEVDRA